MTIAAASYRQVFSHPAFVGLFGGRILMIAATTLQMLALSVAVFRQTDSPFLSAAAFSAGFLPQLLGGALLTSLADRIPARPLLIAAAVLRTLTALALGLLALSPLGAIGLVAGAALFQPLFSGAQGRILPRILQGDAYVLGASMLNVASSAAQLIGLAAGGVLASTLGPQGALLVAAGCQAVAGILSVIALPAHVGAAIARPAAWRISETLEHFLELMETRRVRRIFLLWIVPPALFTTVEALAVSYAGAGHAGSAALLQAAAPAGAMLGDVVIGRFCSPRLRERLVLPLLLLLGAGLVPLAWNPSVGIAAAVVFVSGIGLAFALGLQREFVDLVPDDRHGTAFGLLSTGTNSAQGVGPLLGGALAASVGVGITMAAAGGVIVLLSLVAGRPARPQRG